MQNGPFSFEVLVNGKPLPERYDGECRCFVPASLGHEFILRVRNDLPSRVMAACFVDGMGVIDGEPDEDIPHGYMVEAHSHIEIPGWRLDEENVARFEFQESYHSYAAQMGRSLSEQGLLKCKIYLEKQKAETERPPSAPKSAVDDGLKDGEALFAGQASGGPPTLSSRAADDSGGTDIGQGLMDFLRDKAGEDSASSHHKTDNIGVGFGRKAASQMEDEADFKEASEQPHTVLVMHYDTELGLAKSGIGCPTPPGWNG